MPPKSDPHREEALRLYLDSRGKKSLQCIADELGLSKSTVASWKIRDNWEAILKSSVRKRRSQTSSANGGQKSGHYGNTNAAGKRADVSNFMGNHNALKHGRYEQIKYDTMDEDERALMDATAEQLDPIIIQKRLIQEIEIRERRMYHRIKQLREVSEADPDGFVADFTSVEQNVNKNARGDNKNILIRKTKTNGLDKIQKIEIALTSVQKQKQAAILALHKLEEDQKTRSVEQEKLGMEKQRLEMMKHRLSLMDPNMRTEIMKDELQDQLNSIAALINADDRPQRTFEEFEAEADKRGNQ